MYKILTVVLFVLVIASCKDSGLDSSYTIGDDFIKSETTIAIIDTFEVSLSTFMVDSMVTSGSSIALIGNYKDEELGIVKAKSYFQIGVREESYVVDTRDHFDSLTIKIRYNGEIYGDTTKLQKLNVYRLTQEIETSESGSLYNTSSFKHESEPIGSITLRPEPVNDHNLEIRLSDAWGEKLFDMIKNDSVRIKSTDSFIQYLPGMVIESETDDGAILSFSMADSLCMMKVYAHRFDYELVESEFDFPFTNAGLQFNNISSDRTGTNSALITNDSRKNIKSELTGNHSFAQGGLGMFTRIEFPGLGQVLQMEQKRLLLKAELILKPAYRSYEKIPLPETLYIYESNRVNAVLDPLTDSDDEALTAELVLDDIYYENTYYTYNVTSFISTELGDGYFDVEHALLANISTSKIGSTLDRIIFSDGSKAQFKPILKLYYVFYN